MSGLRLKLDPPSKFGGKPTDHYDEFIKKLRTYLSLHDMKYNELMLWAQVEKLPINEEMMDAHDDVDDTQQTTKRLGTLLYYMFGNLTEGTAYVIVDQVLEQNGWEALRLLHQR